MATSVLLVDDDEALCRALGRELTKHGYEVSLAHGVEDAFSVLIDARVLQRRAVDVLVTDLRMRGWDGLDLLRELHRLSPETSSVLISGFASAKDHERARQLGAVAVLTKPFESKELIDAIDKAVECKTSFHGDLHGLNLVDLVQVFHHGRRSVTLTVSGKVPGEIHLHEGQVIDAVAGDLRGEAALRALLERNSGFLRTSALPVNVTRTISRDVTSLLLDLLQQLDEAQLPGRPPPKR